MSELKTTKHYDAALEQALSDLSNEIAAARTARRKVRDHEDRIADLRQLIAALSKSAEPALRRQVQEKLAATELAPEIEVDRGTPEYQAVIGQLARDPDGAWKVERLQKVLGDLGIETSPKTLHNIVQRLHQKGLLVRIGRGVYQVNGMYINMIKQEDIDHVDE